MKTNAPFNLRSSIRKLVLVLVGILSLSAAWSQTELQLYDLSFADENLKQLLNAEKEAFAQWTIGAEDQAIVRSVRIDIVNSNNNALIKSGVNGGQRTITVSNGFLKTLAKINDAYYIQSAIDGSKNIAEYVAYCASRVDQVPDGPMKQFGLSQQQSMRYCEPYHFNARMGFYVLAVRFVLAHELAHHLYHFGADAPADKLDQEIEADEEALDYLKDSGWYPLLSFPMMLYFHELDLLNTDEELVFTHPSGLERIASMCNASLVDFKATYDVMVSRGPVSMTYEDMRNRMEDIYFRINTQILDDMDQDFDTYLQQAENGNLAAQIKMGVMYFRGTDGWERNDAEGFRWLETAAERSDYAGLLLGMFHEINGDIDEAVAAYLNGFRNYFSNYLIIGLGHWKATGRTDYAQRMPEHTATWFERCMDTCQNDPENSYEECKLYICNYSTKNLFICLVRFRGLNGL